MSTTPWSEQMASTRAALWLGTFPPDPAPRITVVPADARRDLDRAVPVGAPARPLRPRARLARWGHRTLGLRHTRPGAGAPVLHAR